MREQASQQAGCLAAERDRSELVGRDPLRTLRVVAGPRCPRHVPREHVDDHVVVRDDPLWLLDNCVESVDRVKRLDDHACFLENFAARRLHERLPQAHGPARHRPQAATRFLATEHEQNPSIMNHDDADGGHGRRRSRLV